MAPPDRTRKSSGGAFQWPVSTRASAPVASVDASVVVADKNNHLSDDLDSPKASASAEAHLAKLRTRKDSAGSIGSDASRSRTPKHSRPVSMINLSTSHDHPVLSTESGMAVFPTSASFTSSFSAASSFAPQTIRRSVKEPIESNQSGSMPLVGSMPLSAKRAGGETFQNEAYKALRSIQSGRANAPKKADDESWSNAQKKGTRPIAGDSAHGIAANLRTNHAKAAEVLSTAVIKATQPPLATQPLDMSTTATSSSMFPEDRRHKTNGSSDSELRRRNLSRRSSVARRRDGPTSIEAQIHRDSRAVISASRKSKRVTPSTNWTRTRKEAEVNSLLRPSFCSVSVQLSVTAPVPPLLSSAHSAATTTRGVSYAVEIPSPLTAPITWGVTRASSLACLLIFWAEKIM